MIPKLFEFLKKLNIKDIHTPDLNLNLFKIRFALDEFKIEEIKLDINKSSVEIKENLKISLNDLNFRFNASGHFNSTPDLFKGNGTGNYSGKGIDTKIELKLEQNIGKLPRIKLLHLGSTMNQNNTKGVISGSNDILYILNAISNFFMKLLINTFNGAIFKTNELENMFNYIIEKIPTIIKANGIEVNFNAVESQIISNGVLPFNINGTIRCVDGCKVYKRKFKPPKKYIISEEQNDLQISITEYLLNGISVACYQKNMLNFSIADQPPRPTDNVIINRIIQDNQIKLNVKLLSNFIPNITKHYNEDDPFSLKIELIEPPLAEITKGNISLNTTANITIIVRKIEENNINQTALVMEMPLKLKINGSLSHGNITGEILEYKFDSKWKGGNITENEMSTFNRFLNATLKMVIPQINNLLKPGIPIGPIGFFDLNDSSLHFEDGYIKLGINPKIKESELGLIDFSFGWELIKESYEALQQKKMAELSSTKSRSLTYDL